ncbi:MAG: hypothetical protein WAN11_20825 [Syntrophobacteraceae bacterium]
MASRDRFFALLRAFFYSGWDNVGPDDLEAKSRQIERIFACPAADIEHRRPYFTMFGKMHNLALGPIYFPQRKPLVHFLEKLGSHSSGLSC